MGRLGRELLSTEISDGVATMHLIRSLSSTTHSSHRIFRSQDIRRSPSPAHHGSVRSDQNSTPSPVRTQNTSSSGSSCLTTSAASSPAAFLPFLPFPFPFATALRFFAGVSAPSSSPFPPSFSAAEAAVFLRFPDVPFFSAAPAPAPAVVGGDEPVPSNHRQPTHPPAAKKQTANEKIKLTSLPATLPGGHSSELLLDHAPGVARGLGRVEAGRDAQLLEVDFGRGFQAGPGVLEDAELFFGEGWFGGLRGWWGAGRGRHFGGCCCC